MIFLHINRPHKIVNLPKFFWNRASGFRDIEFSIFFLLKVFFIYNSATNTLNDISGGSKKREILRGIHQFLGETSTSKLSEVMAKKPAENWQYLRGNYSLTQRRTVICKSPKDSPDPLLYQRKTEKICFLFKDFKFNLSGPWMSTVRATYVAPSRDSSTRQPAKNPILLSGMPAADHPVCR